MKNPVYIKKRELLSKSEADNAVFVCDFGFVILIFVILKNNFVAVADNNLNVVSETFYGEFFSARVTFGFNCFIDVRNVASCSSYNNADNADRYSDSEDYT